jgi:hypothetical protein
LLLFLLEEAPHTHFQGIESFISFLARVLDWLLNRRHCPQNWQQLVLDVREKINVAIQDMPAVEEVAKLLEGTCRFLLTVIYVA